MRAVCLIASFALLIPLSAAETSTPNTGDQIQAFQFAFSASSASSLVLPIVYTCPTPFTVTKVSSTNAQISDPSAPYTLVALVHEQLYDEAGIQYERLYSASLDMGDMSAEQTIFHPWGNGSQFIACMWAANGVSGGCQDLYTVVPSHFTAEAYEDKSSTCRTPDVLGSWVTPPSQMLDVTVEGASGEIATNAWPPACSDLQFTPNNGTAPYTLIIAPASHPPVNITSVDGASVNYTVRLTHGQAFMAAMFDSEGNSWVYGPMHSGESDDLSCLAVVTGQEESKAKRGYSVAILGGSIAGAFVVGAVGASLVMWCLSRKSGPMMSPSTEDLYANPRPAASYRTSSGSIFGKPLNASSTLDFDTPSTLYDPHLSGPYGSYPQPKASPNVNRECPNSASASSRDRAFPRSSVGQDDAGEYINSYDSPSGYRDSITLADFGSLGKQANENTSRSPTHMGRTGSGDISSHMQETSWNSRRSIPLPLTIQSPVSPSGTHRRYTSFSPRSDSYHSLHSPGAEDSGSPPVTGATTTPRMRNVYVVHSDAGDADVTIQLPEGRNHVVELPPTYRETSSPSSARDNYNNSDHSPTLSGRESMPSMLPLLQRRGSSWESDMAPRPPPLNALQLTRTRASELSTRSGMGEEELRARAEAAMKEKEWLQS
ncbi:hypothetical protein I306_02513 [Cryptococcus gattii EJB2]|uniref:Uncharacterized protein n=1 Tax=Cryptococcus gattii EJB2 TaxID=1296103 RepID=A0ABR5BY17_9TREE|nr:hypothetical protein I306_02513 [Cryptococcus gattii EJB2]